MEIYKKILTAWKRFYPKKTFALNFKPNFKKKIFFYIQSVLPFLSF